MVRRPPGYYEFPEEYDPALKKWTLQTLPFIPEEFKYEVIPGVAKQFRP